MKSAQNLLDFQLGQTILCSHAVFNFLTTIQNQVTFDEKRDALNALSHYASFIRRVNALIGKEITTYNEESDLLNEFLKMEKARFEGLFEYKLIPSEADSSHTLPTFLLIPIVEIVLNTAMKSNTGKIIQLDILLNNSNHIPFVEIYINQLLNDLDDYPRNDEQKKRLELINKKLLSSAYKFTRETNFDKSSTIFKLKTNVSP